MILHWVWYILLAVVLLGGLYLNLLGLPGLWVMVLGTILYALATHFSYAGSKTIIATLLLAGAAELAEFIITGRSAKRAGASRAGLWGAIVGSIIGGIFFTAIIPVPIVGTVFGVCLGTFLGALVGELLLGSEVGVSFRVGLGAAIGRLAGMLTKLGFGVTILATVLIAGAPPIHLLSLFHRTSPATAPAPATLPATLPATSPSKPLG